MLTTKQKTYLKSLAQTEKPIFQVGKGMISDNLIKTINDALRKRELVKISILKNSTDDVKAVAFDLAMLTKSELVQVIGRQVILYKKGRTPKILLP